MESARQSYKLSAFARRKVKIFAAVGAGLIFTVALSVSLSTRKTSSGKINAGTRESSEDVNASGSEKSFDFSIFQNCQKFEPNIKGM